ncbi:MAG: hypothetical protein EXS69_00645 [Candidatus Zambryskibacteria bacterium]|nr:hypothetical protein [Candidatus Zambryskibacteria bacterium]
MQTINRFEIQDLGFKNRLLLLILTTCFLLPTSTFAHGGVNDDKLIIRMTENGFEPKELTVVEDDDVLFINNDEVDRWPASNFHPTHTLYPEFDQKEGLAPGQSWTFKFEKVGTWRMHDHLVPHFTGTIVVLPVPSVVAGENPEKDEVDPPLGSSTSKWLSFSFWTKFKAFLLKFFYSQNNTAENSTQFKNLSEQNKYKWLEDVSNREGPKVAWKLVLDTYNTPEGVLGNPHDMAHLVGQLIYKDYGFEGLSTCTPVFAFGCYHGLMESAFDKNGVRDNEKNHQTDLLSAETGCRQVGIETSPTYWSCIHGMGHGIATFREHNADKSLADCDILKESIRTYCYDGVFMEFSISAPANFYKKSDPIYPCNVVQNTHKTACARSQVQVMRLRFHMDTKSVANVCIKSDNQDIIHHCIDALGYFIAQDATVGGADKIIAGCNVISDKSSAAQCLAAAAGELVFQDSANWHSITEKICASLSGKDAGKCLARITQVKSSYGRK